MIMKNKLNSIFAVAFLTVMSVLVYSCKKTDLAGTSPSADKQVAFFVPSGLGSYTMNAAGQVFKIPVGLTKASDVDRTVNITVTSPTGAVQGTQYTLNTTSIVFEAGTVVDTIVLTGNYNQYVAGRKDTLNFTFTNAEDVSPSLNTSYKVFLRGPCFEGDLETGAFTGSYANTNELFGTSAYGPYTTTISAVTPLTATTGKITVTNIWDSGWGPIDFILDWTNPAARTVTPVAASSGIGDAGTINPAYAGSQVAVRAFAGQLGTFSFCNKTIVLKMQLGVAGLGWFGSLYTVTPAK